MGFLKSIGKGLQKGLDVLTGKKAAKRAEESQDRAREENFRYGEMAADAAHQRSLGLLEAQTEANSYVNQVQDAKNAGLSVGLLYGGGGAGGVGKAGGGAQGAQGGPEGINYLDVEAIKNERTSLAIEKARQATEKMLAKKEAEKIEAETENIKDQTESSSRITPLQAKLLEYTAIEKYIDAARKDFENTDYDKLELKDDELNVNTFIKKGSRFDEQTAVQIAQAIAEAEHKEALTKLTKTQEKQSWTELLNAVKAQNNDDIKTAALKLAAEWQTGEYSNWKTWATIGSDALNTIGELVKAAATKGK